MKKSWLFDPDYSVKDDPEGTGFSLVREFWRLVI